MSGVSRRHAASSVDSKQLVKSVKFSNVIIFVISDSRFFNKFSDICIIEIIVLDVLFRFFTYFKYH